MKTYIGVDLGGTNVRVAKVDEEGNVLQIVKDSTEIGKGTEHVIAKIISLIESKTLSRKSSKQSKAG